MKFRLGILATHPIQYQAPWFRALAVHPQIDLEVFFGHQVTSKEQAAAGFGVSFDWDTPLLDGYNYQFLKNVAASPSADRFGGIDTPEIGGLIRRHNFDAVLLSCGWYFKSAWQGILACWKAGTPVMVRGDSHLNTYRSAAKRTLKALLYRRFVPRFDACLATSKWSKEYFLHYGAPKDRVFFVPHALDEERFSVELNARQGRRLLLRDQWGLDPSAMVYLFSGKFLPNKRPLDFIHAVNLAARKTNNSQIQGLMIGDGPMREECEEAVRKTGAPVRFAGFLNQSQIVDGYVAADVLVLPSAAETWGLVVQEAMFCGRPCIVSDQVGCGPDLIVPGVTGDYFPFGDVESLAERLVSYSGSLSRLAGMGESASKQIGRYSIHQAVEGVLQALGAVTKRHRLA
jgi:glycosyltransferase involved in cell wall biosynthesis